MSALADVIAAVRAFDASVDARVREVGVNSDAAQRVRQQFADLQKSVRTVTTPTGLQLPDLALPQTDDAAALVRYLYGQGAPGEFPFLNGAYKRMYLQEEADGADAVEEPTRLFAGLGLAQDTNARFHFLTRQQRSLRLSTAFDGPTLYGMDSDTPGVFGKIGEGGVAIDTVEDMRRLFKGFDFANPRFSVSMTINGPAPILMAMYVAAARSAAGREVIASLRGTVQADVLKEAQAQNEMLFPLEPALRFLGDMVEYTTAHMPRWYPISISGYHIAEAGATPVQQAAFTLSNGLAYVQMLRERGMQVDAFGPRLSFFLDCGLDVEYLVLARVCRKIWAISMRDVFHAAPRAQIFKLHTQTSGRSLVAAEFQNNLTRTAIELLLAYLNQTNSCHSNSADEPFTTPSEKYVRLAAQAQAILLEESGLFKHTMNLIGQSPGMAMLERVVQDAILDQFAQIDRLGGVMGAIEHRYQRSQIQTAAHHYEQQVYDGSRPIIGLNRYRDESAADPAVRVVRTAASKKREQVARVRQFKARHARKSAKALDALAAVVESNGNVFAELIQTVEHCTLGQITERLQSIVGKFRPSV